MWHAFVGMVASLLLVGTLFAEDEKPTVVPGKKADAPASEVKKETPETKTEPARSRNAARQRVRGEGGGHRGKVTKANLENGVFKLTLDGKDYEFAIGDRTHAILRTMEKDGKEVVVGVHLSNAESHREAAGSRPARKPKVE